jgi:hypothetical protein
VHDGPDLVVHLAVVLERLLQPDQRVQAVVILAHRDVSADLGPAVDQPFVLQDGERLADGVTGDEELCGQRLLGG